MRTKQHSRSTRPDVEARLHHLTSPQGRAGPPPSFGVGDSSFGGSGVAPGGQTGGGRSAGGLDGDELTVEDSNLGVVGRVREFFGDGREFDPGRSGIRALVVLGVVAALVAGYFAWRSQPVAEPLPPPIPASGGGMPSPSPTGNVTVHVTGKVRKPGVRTLPSGSRVIDALTAAGGLKKDTSPGNLNLARRLVDGEQIVAGMPGNPDAAPLSSAGGPLSLNSATAAQLEELPGVGEVLARRIIEYRDSHGGFQSVEQLREISGIGERKFAELKDKVSP